MSPIKKSNILFIQQNKSLLDANTKVFNQLFNKVDKALGKEEVLKLFDANKYDIIISDLTMDAEEVVLLKEIKDKKSKQIVFALLDPRDSDKLYKIANFDINAFELTSEQFDLALEEIARFNPS